MYKGQGLNQRGLVSRVYWEFLVDGGGASPRAQSRAGLSGYPSLSSLGAGGRSDPLSVARVRPRTSKGITDLLLLHLARLVVSACPSKKLVIRARAGAEN